MTWEVDFCFFFFLFIYLYHYFPYLRTLIYSTFFSSSTYVRHTSKGIIFKRHIIKHDFDIEYFFRELVAIATFPSGDWYFLLLFS